MTPHSLTLHGFKSFTQRTEFEFPQRAGLYQIKGENGAGKTSVLDGLCWVLYGKTLRGVKGPSVVSWKGKTCKGRCHMETPLGFVEVYRSQSPNDLKVSVDGGDWKVVDQDKIDQLLGLSYENFIHTIVYGQFASLFFDLSATEKLRVFADCLNLDIWEQAAKVASKRVVDIENKIASLHARRSVFEAQQAQLKELRSEGEMKKSIAAMTKESNALQTKIENIESNLAQMKRTFKTYNDSFEQRNEEMRQLNTNIRDLQTRQGTLGATLGNIDAKEEHCKSVIKDLQKQLKRIEQDDSVCPSCGQEMSAKQRSKLIKEVQSKIESKEQESKGLFLERAKAQNQFNDTKSDMTQNQLQKKKLSDQVDAMSEERNKLDGQIRGAQSTLDTLHREKGKMDMEIVSLEQSLKDAQQQSKAIAKDLEDLEKDLKFIESRGVQYKYWSDEFKQIRLWIIDSALEELRVLTNSYLDQLGLVGWEVDYQVERDRKDGKGVIRGFNIVIRSPTSPDGPVPWESWSGGQTQRLRVAGTSAMSALLRSRMGIESRFEAWDEPTVWLNKPGVTDLLEFLAGRADKLDRCVWLIDHRSLNAGRFAQSFEVKLTPNGSVIESA